MGTKKFCLLLIIICITSISRVKSASDDEGKATSPRKDRHSPRIKEHKEAKPYTVVIPRSESQLENLHAQQVEADKTRERRHSATPSLILTPREQRDESPQPQSARENRLSGRLSFMVDDKESVQSCTEENETHLVLGVSDPTSLKIPQLDLHDIATTSEKHDSSIIIHIPDDVLNELAQADPQEVKIAINELIQDSFGMTAQADLLIDRLQEIISEEVSQILQEQRSRPGSSASSSGSGTTSETSSSSSSSGHKQINLSQAKITSSTPPKEIASALRKAVLKRVQSKSALRGAQCNYTGDEYVDFRTWMLAELNARDRMMQIEHQRLVDEQEQLKNEISSERRKKILAFITLGITTSGTIATAIITYFATKNANK